MGSTSSQHNENVSSSNVDLERAPDPNEATTMKKKGSPFNVANISFLCPNGHKLNAPASLQGRVGQCPHCKAKFRIPTLVEESSVEIAGVPTVEAPVPTPSAAEVAEEPIEESASESVVAENSALANDSASQISEIAPSEIREITPSALGMSLDQNELGGNSPSSGVSHSLMSIFDTLWEERAHGAVVELHLADGVIVTPDWWAQSLSATGYGVFALENRDGSYQMEAIAWDSVQRIIVRNITELPGGLFA